VVIKLILMIAAGVVLFAGYRAAASASLFQLRTVDVRGTERASVEAIQTIVRRDAAQTGVWQADLKQIGAHLEQLLWVRSAIVSRVLPDGMRVRVTERVPRAVVRLSTGRFAWVDDDAVLLGEMKPTDEMPPFFVRGWNEEQSETARVENSERIKKYLELHRLWEVAGLSERVSEVNLIDVRDVRAQLAGDDSQIEVRLGSTDLGKRLQQALEVLDEQRRSPRGSFISYVDLTQGKRAIVGFVSGAHAIREGSGSSGSPKETEKKPEQTAAKQQSESPRASAREKDARQASTRNRNR
jgi:cell division protein FtsQ